MLQKDTHTKLSRTTVTLHWIVAIMMIGMLASGLYMTNFKDYSIYSWHKSFGVVIAAFVIARVLWRIKNGWPIPVGDPPKIEHLLAKAVHYALIFGTVLMPLSGMMMTIMSGRPLLVFGFELIGANLDPATGKRIPINGDLAGIFATIHEYAAYIIIGALALHIIGALKHHVIDKDGTLKRILGKSV